MKRKREPWSVASPSNGPDTSKPTAVFKPTSGRPYTVSLALPGSIIANAQTHDLKTLLAGQIARALAVFCIDEIVIFDDGSIEPRKQQQHYSYSNNHYAAPDDETGYTAFSDPSNFLYHLLSYLESPPYLRRALFPYHANLKTAGSLPSLDMPHHLRRDEWCIYREGVTVAAPPTTASNPAQAHEQRDARKDKHKKRNKDPSTGGDLTTPSATTYATAGIPNPIHVSLSAGAEPLPPNVRLTLKFAPPYSENPPPLPTTPIFADAVSPDEPREEGGYYWGYTTRFAASLSAVFEEAPYADGYDFSVGTSERGEPLERLLERARRNVGASTSNGDAADDNFPKWQHLLVVFGGVAGLEVALKNDKTLRDNGVTDVSGLFDSWVNLLEGQGSRTIRTEEAVWIGLMGLKGFIECNKVRWE